MRYGHDEDKETLDCLITHLKEIEIPSLPERYKQLENDIKAAHDNMVCYPTDSTERLNAEYRWKRLKAKRKSWPNFCAQFDMNVNVLEEYREKRFGAAGGTI